MRLVALALTLALASTACGSGEDDGSGTNATGLACDEPECRGDFAGSWTIQGACVNRFDLDDDRSGCPEWVCKIVGIEASGKLDFGSDGSADVDFSTTLTSKCTVPKSCLQDDGIGSCDEYANGPGSGQRTCSDAGQSCDCTETETQAKQIVGTWEIQNGTFLSIKSATGMSGGNDWCVKNGELRMSWLRSGNSASPTAKAILIAR